MGGGGGDVRVHSDNYPAYKHFLLLRLFFFSWHKFVFCVLCFVCVLWLERETETENTTYIQERLKRRKYVMSNFSVVVEVEVVVVVVVVPSFFACFQINFPTPFPLSLSFPCINYANNIYLTN